MRVFFEIFGMWISLAILINVTFNYGIINIVSTSRYMSMDESYVLSLVAIIYIKLMNDIFEVKK